MPGVVAVALAVACVCVAFSASLGRTFILEQDDVNHDGATSAVYSRAGSKGARGRLSASSSVSDFFAAAMHGDFTHDSKNVKLATDGLFHGKESVGVAQLKASEGVAKLKTRGRGSKRAAGLAQAGASLGRQQQLAEAKLTVKAAHVALARQTHSERAAVVGGSRSVHHMEMRRRPISRNYEKGWKYPTEDTFVARYTGGMPSGVVPVDSFTTGPYVPI